VNEIVVRLVGGLGTKCSNTLRNGVPLRLDTSWFAGVCDRHYALAPFRIEATLLPKQPARTSRYWGRLDDCADAQLGLGRGRPQRAVLCRR
jgi:hypothetical protein